jgi:hypothetical protein
MAIFGGVARDVMPRGRKLEDCVQERMSDGMSETEARAASEGEAD